MEIVGLDPRCLKCLAFGFWSDNFWPFRIATNVRGFHKNLEGKSKECYGISFFKSVAMVWNHLFSHLSHIVSQENIQFINKMPKKIIILKSIMIVFQISKMEHQQAQHQQYLTLEGLDNSNARAVVVKLINVLLTVLQVILLLVATIAGIIMPFLRTRLRVLSTIVALAAFVVVVKQWPEVRNITEFLATYFKQFLSVKQ